MTIPIRRQAAERRRPAFNLRRTTFGFALVALLLWGGGLTLRLAWQAAGRHPVAAVLVSAVVCAGAVALLRGRRDRRMARTVAGAVTDATHELLDAAAPEPTLELTTDIPAPVPVDYAAMDAAEFEAAVAGLCERDGCQDVHVVGGAGDLGADVVALTPDGRRVVVQCKCYGPTNKVGSQDLQRFGGTCYAVHEAEIAVVVTTSEFTEPAADYADRCGILRVDRPALDAWSDGSGPPPWAWQD
ncbi:restriction endonuclease [Streptomyces sp. DT24]|uniref:restriction endonuclease n=1 Tax=unclassified Streptomyces TaxID=2593676 RepID=UPI0023B9675A|nr:restriction endonuclease [Streptomyces sp. AM 4-1-1]WEH36732.1 restriction endonuclease [Streptomyces sp. AM 4-1-1]